MIVTLDHDTFNEIQGQLCKARRLLDALGQLVDNFHDGDENEMQIETHSAIADAVRDKLEGVDDMLNEAWEAAKVKTPAAQTVAPARTPKCPSASKAAKPRRRAAA
jgi:hypothetical protein